MGKKLVAVAHTVLMVPLFFLYTMILASVLIVSAAIKRDNRFIERLIRFWSHSFLLAGGVRLKIEPNPKVESGGQYVFIANHLSNFDIPTMFVTAPVPIRYLSKKEVYKIPLVATAMRMVGIVRVDREAGAAVHAEVNAGVADAKRRGHSLIIFPEGTRSVTGELQRFKKGAFRIAISNSLPIVPVTIQGTWEAWRPGSKLIYGGKARTVIHDPIPTSDLTLSDMDAVRDEVHRIIEKSYSELRART